MTQRRIPAGTGPEQGARWFALGRMRVQAVLFDLDGTLVDSNEFHVRAWDQAFRETGQSIPVDAIRKQIGKGADKLVPAILPDADEKRAEELGGRHGEIFKASYLDEVRPFPFAHDLLARVHAGGRQVVLASSASQEELDHYIKLLGAGDLVAASTSIDDVSESKPAPEIFATALKKLGGIAAEAALAVGDSPYDVASARGCGVATVALRSGGFSDEALEGALTLYDDAAALLAGFATSPLNR